MTNLSNNDRDPRLEAMIKQHAVAQLTAVVQYAEDRLHAWQANRRAHPLVAGQEVSPISVKAVIEAAAARDVLEQLRALLETARTTAQAAAEQARHSSRDQPLAASSPFDYQPDALRRLQSELESDPGAGGTSD